MRSGSISHIVGVSCDADGEENPLPTRTPLPEILNNHSQNKQVFVSLMLSLSLIYNPTQLTTGEETVDGCCAFGAGIAPGRQPGSPWENGYVESHNSRMRDELLDGELFLHIDEMKYVAKRWQMDYNSYRAHSGLGYMTPARFAERCRQAGGIRLHTPVLDRVQDCGLLS